MPITNTSGFETGDLRLLEVRRGKIKCRYKIICNFCWKRWICRENLPVKHNNYRWLEHGRGIHFAVK